MRTWWQRVVLARDEKGWSDAELAKRAGIDYQRLAKWTQGTVKQPRGDALERLADALGVKRQWLQDESGEKTDIVRVIGYASGGEQWEPAEESGDGLEEVALRVDWPDAIAIKVRGPSMVPVFNDGDVLVCDRRKGLDAANFLNRDCVVKTEAGDCYIKRVLPGSRKGHFRLRSYNHAYPDIEPVRLEWIAPVIWIKRA